MEYRLSAPDPIYGNARNDMYNLPPLPLSMSEAKDFFYGRGVLYKYYLRLISMQEESK